jgi:Ca2+-binding RTX toxin-like protein
VIGIFAGSIEISTNGGAFAVCGAGDSLEATVDYIKVTGSDAGNEKFTIFNPVAFAADNMSVNLGNGTDSLTWEYGALASPATPDPSAVGADAVVGTTAVGGLEVGDFDNNGVADIRIENAETQTLNGGDSADTLDAGTANFIGFDFPSIAGTGDAVPAGTKPAAVNLTLNGGSGDDTLVSGNGDDNFQGGPGADGVSYVAAAGPVQVTLTLNKGVGMGNDTLADVQNVIGGDFADTIQGNALDNVLSGGDGDDRLLGEAGTDTVNGDAGDDQIIEEGPGPNGADTLSGGTDGFNGTTDTVGDTLDYSVARSTPTIVKPGAGAVSGEDADNNGVANENDTVLDDFETIMTGSGGDTIVALVNSRAYFTDGGNDTITGDAANEYFDPGNGVNTVDGNAGADELDLSSQTGPSTIAPAPAPLGLGADAYVAQAATTPPTFADGFQEVEKLDGTAQADTLTLGDTSALTRFVAGDGDDSIIWDGVAFLPDFSGGGGTDVVDASSSTTAVVINLGPTGPGAFTPGNDVENAIGGSAGDALTGNVLNNVLTGNDGADVISAGTGNDTVEGGLGNDTLIDGGGADTLVYRNAPSGETIDTANGFASGGDGDDTLTGNFETVLGSDFADNITAGQTAFDLPNTIKGFGGNDSIIGSNSTDTLAGGKGNDDIHGGGGDDTIKGSGGNDTLLGSSGDDTIKGGNGNDSLVGGKGFDVGNGGKGKDTCKQIESAHSC